MKNPKTVLVAKLEYCICFAKHFYRNFVSLQKYITVKKLTNASTKDILMDLMEIFGLDIRPAEIHDIPVVLDFIKALAEYEKLSHEVTATEESLGRTLFGEKRFAEVVIGYDKSGTAAGFALFFHNYSTFLGKPGIYLEDLFVKPELRGKSYGKALLVYLAKLALERDCGRLEWSVLDWNTPAIEFYKSLGATMMEEWTGCRVTGQTLKKLGEMA